MHAAIVRCVCVRIKNKHLSVRLMRARIPRFAFVKLVVTRRLYTIRIRIYNEKKINGNVQGEWKNYQCEHMCVCVCVFGCNHF